MPIKKETMGDRIKRIREEHGITQAGLAAKCSTILKGHTITRATISNYENGAKDIPKAPSLLLIAHALSVDPYYLLFGEAWLKMQVRK